VEKTREVRAKLLEFIRMRRKDLLKDIAQQKKLTPEIKKGLEEVLAEYKNLA
jgi:F0F1-type ATP synthase alpha subunit